MRADYPFPGYHQQQNNLPKTKKLFPRLASVPSQVLQTNIRRLHDAWDFFQKRGYGFPRFKKYGQMKSILFPQFKVNPITGNEFGEKISPALESSREEGKFALRG